MDIEMFEMRLADLDARIREVEGGRQEGANPVMPPFVPIQQLAVGSAPACYDLTVSNVQNATAALTFENRYYRCGGKTYEGSTAGAQGVSLPCIVALRIDLTGSAPSDTITSYTDLAALKAAEANNDYFTCPLYKLDAAGSVVCDFRTGPLAAQWDFSS